MSVTKNLAKYVDDKGFNLSEMSRKTNIPYSVIYTSLCDDSRNRDLRAEELISICRYIGKNPMDFADAAPRHN